MKVKKYGITLHLMKEEDIEMVRQWRNEPSVVTNYEYQEYITPEMQKAWFKTVYNTNNIYMIIEYEGEKIGVVNAKDVDYEKQTAESGIFIPDSKYSNTYIPAIVMILCMETGFKLFNFAEGHAHVLKTNTHVQKMTKSLGFELCPGQEDVENQLYSIDRDRFYSRAKKLLIGMNAVKGKDEPILFSFAKSEMNDPVIQEWHQIFSKNTAFSKVEDTGKETVYYLY